MQQPDSLDDVGYGAMQKPKRSNKLTLTPQPGRRGKMGPLTEPPMLSCCSRICQGKGVMIRKVKVEKP